MRARRDARHAAVAGALALGWIGLATWSSTPAVSAGTVESAWWWRGQPSAAPVVPPPPDVADGQIQVGADPDGAAAIAAVRLPSSVSTGAGHASVLVLRVANITGTPGDITACRTSDAWTPIAAGPLASAPRGSCTEPVIRATPGADAWELDIHLLLEDTVSLVLLPGAATLPWRVTFEQPLESDVRRVEAVVDRSTPAPVLDAPTTAAATPPPPRLAPTTFDGGQLDAALGPDAVTSEPVVGVAPISREPSRSALPRALRPAAAVRPIRKPSPFVLVVAAGIAATYLVAARRASTWLGRHPLRSRPPLLGGASPATHELAGLLGDPDAAGHDPRG
jgi:hypothetical protein